MKPEDILQRLTRVSHGLPQLPYVEQIIRDAIDEIRRLRKLAGEPQSPAPHSVRIHAKRSSSPQADYRAASCAGLLTKAEVST